MRGARTADARGLLLDREALDSPRDSYSGTGGPSGHGPWTADVRLVIAAAGYLRVHSDRRGPGSRKRPYRGAIPRHVRKAYPAEVHAALWGTFMIGKIAFITVVIVCIFVGLFSALIVVGMFQNPAESPPKNS